MQPLADRIRPQDSTDYIGQAHLLGDGKSLSILLQQKKIPSLVLWGPPGTGKTTLAHIIAKQMEMPLFQLSAITSGVKEVREILALAQKSQGAILFIDEIHHFNKTQQDTLLPAVEKGVVTLIGATTENPSFELIKPLLSRCQIYVLEHFTIEDLKHIVDRALQKDVILSQKNIKVEAYEALFYRSGGDARKLLNLLELIINSSTEDTITIDNALVEQISQQKIAMYDKSGEQHYDIISAFIKSIRGSDPNAAVYYLARMIEGGEKPTFIARRLLILASEDIGNANPNALMLAQSCFSAVEQIGYPECDLILSQCTIYLACSPKSNASYKAIRAAQALVRNQQELPVPLYLRNAPTQLMKKLDYGTDYKYAHDYPHHFVDIEFLPQEISGTRFYEPADNPREAELQKYLRACWKEKYGY